MAEMSLEELLEITEKRINKRKPNAAIVAQLTSGREHRGSPRSEVELVAHVSVDFIRGASIAIGIVQQIECPMTGSIVSCDLEPSALKFGYQSEILRQAQLETPKDAQLFALTFAMALGRRTIQDRWPQDLVLRAIKFGIGLTRPEPRYHIAELVIECVEGCERDPQILQEVTARMHSILQYVSRLKVEMATRFEGLIKPICFENEQERTSAYHMARRKQKSLQSSPRWKKRWQRDPMVTNGQSRVKKIVQEYRTRTGC